MTAAGGFSTVWILAYLTAVKLGQVATFSHKRHRSSHWATTNKLPLVFHLMPLGFLGLSANCSTVFLRNHVRSAAWQTIVLVRTCQMSAIVYLKPPLHTHTASLFWDVPKHAEAPHWCTSHMLKSFPVFPLFLQCWARDWSVNAPCPLWVCSSPTNGAVVSPVGPFKL